MRIRKNLTWLCCFLIDKFNMSVPFQISCKGFSKVRKLGLISGETVKESSIEKLIVIEEQHGKGGATKAIIMTLFFPGDFFS